MTGDPIRRRFGHGAARLPIGLPAGVERLSRLAQRSVPVERRLMIVPFVCVIVLVWLIAAGPIAPPVAPTAPLQVALESWPVPEATARPQASRPTPPPAATREIARREPTARPTATPTPTPPHVAPRPELALARPTETLAPATRFDPAQLTTRGARDARGDVLSGDARMPAPARAALDLAAATASASPGELPAAVAHAARATTGRAGSPSDFPADFRTLPTSAGAARANGARPRAGGGDAAAATRVAAGSGRGDHERRDFLAGLGRDAADGAATGRPTAERRPEVSAARSGSGAFGADSARPFASGGGAGTRGDVGGWQEVPLDELPDCDPPGRQDLLKKRILLAASVQRECSHPSGSYRFVETRSLGAFLMWSRPNPAARAGQPRDRDACDVLERALACLGDPGSEESTSR